MFECLPARSAAPVPPPSLFIDKTARSRFAPRESEAAAHGTPPNCYTYTTVGGREGRREKCRRDRGRELGRGGADGTRAVDGRRAWWLRAKSPIRRKEIVVGGGSRGRGTPAGQRGDCARKEAKLGWNGAPGLFMGCIITSSVALGGRDTPNPRIRHLTCNHEYARHGECMI